MLYFFLAYCVDFMAKQQARKKFNMKKVENIFDTFNNIYFLLSQF